MAMWHLEKVLLWSFIEALQHLGQDLDQDSPQTKSMSEPKDKNKAKTKTLLNWDN